MENLKEKSDLANRILNSNTKYSKDKCSITGYFNQFDDKYSIDIIESQLTIIDSYYSTNMLRRYYGIEDIAASILKISNDKQELIQLFSSFLDNPSKEDDVYKLFVGIYGCNKLGYPFGKAFSLISKYAYFLLEYQFPIYDSIAIEVYPLITGNPLNEDIIEYISDMKQLNVKSGICDYNRLDNLLWLIGKINRGNYSLLLPKDKYLNLVTKFKIDRETKSNKIDEKIFNHIKDNINNLNDILSKDQIEIIKFSIKLKDREYILS